MMRFDRFGLAFDHPENWGVDVGDAEGRFAAVTVYSPGGAFWSVSGHAPGGDSSRLAEAILLEMRREYRDLDSEAASDEVGGRTLRGFDLNFYCLDLTNTAHIRTLETPGAIYLLHCQAEDREWEKVQPVFAAMTASFVDGLAGSGRASRGDGRR